MVNTLLAGAISLGSFSVAILDLIALAVLIIAVLVGLAKGFAKQVLSLLGLVASIIISFMLCSKLAEFVSNNMPGVVNGVRGLVQKIFGLTADSITTQEALRSALAASKIPAFLHEALIKSFIEGVGMQLLNVFTSWALNIICFVFLLIFTRIAFAIIKGIILKFVNLPLIRTVDKLLGAVFAVIKFMLYMVILFLILSPFVNLNSLLQPDGVTCHLNNVLQFVSNMNIISKLFTVVI